MQLSPTRAPLGDLVPMVFAMCWNNGYNQWRPRMDSVCFFFYLFVSEAVLPCVLCQELAVVFLHHLSLSPQWVITEVSSFYISVWKSSYKTGKKPRPDWTLTVQDQDFSGPIKTATAVRSLVYHYFKIFKTNKNQSQPVSTGFYNLGGRLL